MSAVSAGPFAFVVFLRRVLLNSTLKMSSPEISEDEEGLSDIQLDADQYSTLNSEDVVDLCSEDETDTYYTSDEDLDLPAVDLAAKKSAVIKNLFPGPSTSTKQEKYAPKIVPSSSKQKIPAPVHSPEKPKDPGIVKMIGGVKINLPVKPYPSQIALMAQVSSKFIYNLKKHNLYIKLSIQTLSLHSVRGECYCDLLSSQEKGLHIFAYCILATL